MSNVIPRKIKILHLVLFILIASQIFAQTAPTVTITSQNTGVYGSTITLATNTGGSTGAVTYTVANGTGSAVVSGNTLKLTGVGTVTITATVAPDATFSSGTGTQIMAITPASLTITPSTAHRGYLSRSATVSGGALNISSPDNYVDCGNPSLITGLGSNSFTIEAWINANAASVRRHILAIGNVNTNQGLFLFINASNQLQADLSARPGPVSSVTVADGAWHHVALVNLSGTFQLYVDGVQVGSKSMTPLISSGSFVIGSTFTSTASAVQPLLGSIDELRIWNLAKSSAEISASMDIQVPANSAGLLAYYTFDQGVPREVNFGLTTLYDAATQSIKGTLKNFALIGSNSNWVEGISNVLATGHYASGGALNFSGTDNYVDCGNPSLITGLGKSSFTIEAWINATAGSVRRNIVAIGNPNISEGLFLFINNANKLQADISYLSGPASSVVVADGTWHHVALVNLGGTFQLYVDGVRVGSKLMSPNISTGSFVIGSSFTNTATADTPFIGSIDELRIWNVPKPSEEISASMNDQVPSNSTGLLACYRFDQGVLGGANPGLTTLTDVTAGSINGTLKNFSLNGASSNWVAGISGVIAETYNVSGLVNGDITSASVNLYPIATTTATRLSPTGTYQLNLSGGAVSNNYSLSLNAGNFIVDKITPTVSITSKSSGANGDVIILTTDAGGSTGAIVYTVANGTGSASLSGDNLSLISGGTVTVTASVSGDANCYPAIATQTVTIGKIDQTINFTIADKTLGDPAFPLTASATSGLAVTYTTSSQKVTISGNQVTLAQAGRVNITATQAGNSTYNPVALTQSFCINPVKPTVSSSFSSPSVPILTSSSSTGNQWYLEGSLINGANSNMLTVSHPGSYTVQATIDDCHSVLSDAKIIVVTRVEPMSQSTLLLYPNPSTNSINIQVAPEIIRGQNVRVEIHDNVGKTMSQGGEEMLNHEIDVSKIPAGLYLVKIFVGKEAKAIKFIKN